MWNLLRWLRNPWTLLLLLILLAVIVLCLGLQLMRANRPLANLLPPLPKEQPPQAIPQAQGPEPMIEAMDERLKPAARRLWGGFTVYPSENAVPWNEVLAEVRWSEEQRKLLEVIEGLLVDLGDKDAIRLFRGRDRGEPIRILPMAKAPAYPAAGKLVLLHTLHDEEGKVIYLNHKLLESSHAGTLYYLHATLLRASVKKEAIREKFGPREFQQRHDERQLRFARDCRKVFAEFPNAPVRETALLDLEFLAPDAFK